MARQPTPSDVSLFAFAAGLSRENKAGQTIDCFFPAPVRAPGQALCEAIRENFEPGVSSCPPDQLLRFADRLAETDPAGLPPGLLATTRAMLEADRPLRIVAMEADADIEHTAEAYLKLHLRSHRLALPNTLNLKNIFAHLPNVAWTCRGAIDVGDLNDALLQGRISGDHL